MIYELTHDQPFLIQALCQKIINLINAPNMGKVNSISADLVEEAIEIVVKENQIYFDDLWKDAGETERDILRHLAINEPDTLSDRNRAMLEDMERRLLIEKNEGAQWQIQVPLVKDWVEIFGDN